MKLDIELLRAIICAGPVEGPNGVYLSLSAAPDPDAPPRAAVLGLGPTGPQLEPMPHRILVLLGPDLATVTEAFHSQTRPAVVLSKFFDERRASLDKIVWSLPDPWWDELESEAVAGLADQAQVPVRSGPVDQLAVDRNRTIPQTEGRLSRPGEPPTSVLTLPTQQRGQPALSDPELAGGLTTLWQSLVSMGEKYLPGRLVYANGKGEAGLPAQLVIDQHRAVLDRMAQELPDFTLADFEAMAQDVGRQPIRLGGNVDLIQHLEYEVPAGGHVLVAVTGPDGAGVFFGMHDEIGPWLRDLSTGGDAGLPMVPDTVQVLPLPGTLRLGERIDWLVERRTDIDVADVMARPLGGVRLVPGAEPVYQLGSQFSGWWSAVTNAGLSVPLIGLGVGLGRSVSEAELVAVDALLAQLAGLSRVPLLVTDSGLELGDGLQRMVGNRATVVWPTQQGLDIRWQVRSPSGKVSDLGARVTELGAALAGFLAVEGLNQAPAGPRTRAAVWMAIDLQRTRSYFGRNRSVLREQRSVLAEQSRRLFDPWRERMAAMGVNGAKLDEKLVSAVQAAAQPTRYGAALDLAEHDHADAALAVLEAPDTAARTWALISLARSVPAGSVPAGTVLAQARFDLVAGDRMAEGLLAAADIIFSTEGTAQQRRERAANLIYKLKPWFTKNRSEPAAVVRTLVERKVELTGPLAAEHQEGMTAVIDAIYRCN